MAKKKNKYVFKYDKHNNLCNYIEKDSNSNLLSLFTYNYKINSLVRYDRDSKLRIFTQFDEPCKLVHKFEAGESWVKSIPLNQHINQYQNPKIKKQFALNNENQIVRFGFQQHLVSDFIKI